jgi:hypothetical protein
VGAYMEYDACADGWAGIKDGVGAPNPGMREVPDLQAGIKDVRAPIGAYPRGEWRGWVWMLRALHGVDAGALPRTGKKQRMLGESSTRNWVGRLRLTFLSPERCELFDQRRFRRRDRSVWKLSLIHI